ncbi:MAG: acyltransferase family protein, partial [Catenulispora sp.]
FFVLSGFLITSLLLAEAGSAGAISLRRFYFRRARRLLPAVLVMIASVAVTVAVWIPDQAARLRGDIAASLGYATNWWLIGQHASYFGGGDRPSPLRHLWSLAVEEQFYLAWPVVLIVLLAVLRGSRRAVFVTVVLGIAASAALMWSLYSPWQDTSRLYYGTDTRAAPLLVGAALALWRAGGVAPRPVRSKRIRRLDLAPKGVVGLLALASVVATCVLARDTSAFLYRGGFVAVAVATAVVIASVASGGRCLAFLRARPLVWLGTRSYAVYLWHWPVFDLVRPGFEVHTSPAVTRGVECCAILVLAELSFRLVEDPIRRGGLGRLAGRARRGKPAARAAAAVGLAFTVGLAGATAAAAAVGLQTAARTHRPTSAAADLVHPDVPLNLRPTAGAATPTPSSPTSAPAVQPTSPPTVVHHFATPVHVSVFGDSQGMTLVLNKPPDTSRYLSLDDQTVEGCGIMQGRIASRSGEKRDLTANCASWPQKWAANAAAAKPQIALVMLGAWDVFDVQLPGRTLVFGTPEWDTEFMARLDQGVGILRSSGAQIALAQLPVYRPVGKPGAGAGFWPERGDDTRIAHVNMLLKSYASRHAAGGATAAVSLISPPVEFSAGNPIASDTAFRWDGVHFYKAGAQLYLKTVIPQLLAIPSP